MGARGDTPILLTESHFIMQRRTNCRRFCVLTAVLFTALPSFSSQAATFLEIDAEPEEFLFAGTDVTATSDEGELVLQYNAPNQLSGSFTWADQSNNNVQLTFYSGAQRAFDVGGYLNARGPFWTDGQLEPATDIFLIGAGRACNSNAGEFIVYEFEPNANPSRYAINFTQYCAPGNQAKIHGILRINSDVPRNDTNPIAAIALPSQAAIEGRSVVLNASSSRAQQGDLVGYSWSQLAGPEVQFEDTSSESATIILPQDLPLGGASVELKLTVTDSAGNQGSATTDLHVASKSDPQSFFRLIDGSDFPADTEGWTINIDQKHLLNFVGGPLGVMVDAKASSADALGHNVSMSPPEGQPFAVGEYLNTTRFSGEFGALDYSSNGYGCNEAFGSFEVLDVDSEGDELTRLHARYTHYCESLEATPTSGEIGFGVFDPNVPKLDIAAIDSATEGDTIILDASASTDEIGTIETYQWTGPANVVLQNSGAAVASFTAPEVVGTSPVTLQFTLHVTDSDGYQARKSVAVVVTPEAEEPPPPPKKKKSGGATDLWIWLSLSMLAAAATISKSAARGRSRNRG